MTYFGKFSEYDNVQNFVNICYVGNTQMFWLFYPNFIFLFSYRFFWPKAFRNRQNTGVFGWWPKSNYILSISWNFLTRQSQEFMDYLPLIYKKSLFNMNFQFVRWLVVTTSISSKWLHENTTWYIISFSTRFIFQVCYYDSEKWFYVCGKLVLIWS